MPSSTEVSHQDVDAEGGLTLRIVPVVGFTFVAYLCIGIPLSILPSYFHQRYGVSAVFAGLLVSLQYIATFASRPRAGHMADTIGPRKTVRYGLLSCAASGAFVLLAAMLHRSFGLSLFSLVLSRLTLGVGESMSSTGAIMWGIGRVGPENTAKVIAWNGVATYGALAIGAPLGAILEHRWGFSSVGALVLVVSAASYVLATSMAPTKIYHSEPVAMRKILFGVTPYGLALALGSMGFGVIATFITLYFAQLNWQGAALSLTVYGVAFMAARLTCSGLIDRLGGFPVAVVSFVIEAVGLLMLGLGHTQMLAYIGCGVTGLGFSLIFPALGVEAANAFPSSVRGSVLGIYSAFVDFSLFLTGPLAGLVISMYGYSAVFLGAAGAVFVSLGGTIWLASHRTRIAGTDILAR
jgi:MFS family permease